MSNLKLTIVLAIASFSIIAQSYTPSLDQAETIQLLADLPMDSSFVWLEKNKGASIEDFRPVGDETLRRAYAHNEPSLIAKAHAAHAAWNAYIGHYPADSTLYHNEKALHFYDLAKNDTMKAVILNNLSADYSRMENYEASINSILGAIEIYERLGDEVGVYTGYKNLGFQYGIYGQHEKAIEYSERAMKEFARLNEYALLTYASVNILNSYNQMNMEDKALKVAERCLEIVKTKVPHEVFVEMKTYAYRHETYLNLKDYDNALADAERAHEIALKELGLPRSDYYRLEIGNVLRMKGQCKEALPHLQAAADIYTKMGRLNFKDPQEYLADCYEKLGLYEKALKHHKTVSGIEVDFLEGTIRNLESEAVIKYETGKKDQAIAERDSMLEQRTKVQYLTLGITALLAVFLLTLFYYFRKNKRTADALAKKNEENELLLKEIHHRVKNNLQTISSLLNLQSESISDHAAYDAVQESKNRVASMALIHQKLYQGENLAAIEMKDYFKTVGQAIFESFGKKAEKIALDIEMDNVELDVDTAIPIGLITNELLTNSLKYAFPEESEGTIKISLNSYQKDQYTLTISDNGRGMQNLNTENSQGFGALLIQLLTAQLGGKIEKDSADGTTVILNFMDQAKAVA